MPLLKPNKIGSSKDQIAIKEIREDVLVLEDNRYRAVIESSSLNFELKSEAEQDAIIDIYQSFLNSLDCSIQIIIRTREIDLDSYLADIAKRKNHEDNPIYRQQLENYIVFVKSLVSINRILSRHFYLIVPLDSDGKQDFSFIKEQLELKTDIIIKGLQRIGMHARLLDGLEIADLFYSFYLPASAKRQPLRQAVVSANSSMAVRRRHEN